MFRADAGPEVGLGHLQRCLALGTALERVGARCCFLVNETNIVGRWVAAQGFPVEIVPDGKSWTEGDCEQAVAIATHRHCRAVVFDSYRVRPEYLWRLRAAGLFVVLIDDLARDLPACHLVVNGDAHAQELPYRPASGDTAFLLGPRYAMLRPDFWASPVRVCRPHVLNVLVAAGGADPVRLGPTALGVLDDQPGEFEVTVIVGPFFDDLRAPEAAAWRTRRRVRLVRAPTSVGPLMVAADLAVSAAGQTLYELACTGCPTVAVQVAANQAGHLQALAAAGVVMPVGGARASSDPEAISRAVARLLADPEARSAAAAAGQRLVDGRGAIRVAEAIVTRAGGMAKTPHERG